MQTRLQTIIYKMLSGIIIFTAFNCGKGNYTESPVGAPSTDSRTEDLSNSNQGPLDTIKQEDSRICDMLKRIEDEYDILYEEAHKPVGESKFLDEDIKHRINELENEMKQIEDKYLEVSDKHDTPYNKAFIYHWKLSDKIYINNKSLRIKKYKK